MMNTTTDRLVYTIEELWAEADREKARRRKRNRFGKRSLVLTGGGYKYRIDAGRIDTPAKLLHWIKHLSEKAWVTKWDLVDVMDYATWRWGVNPFEADA